MNSGLASGRDSSKNDICLNYTTAVSVLRLTTVFQVNPLRSRFCLDGKPD